jgi:hypothetical protein
MGAGMIGAGMDRAGIEADDSAGIEQPGQRWLNRARIDLESTTETAANCQQNDKPRANLI